MLQILLDSAVAHLGPAPTRLVLRKYWTGLAALLVPQLLELRARGVPLGPERLQGFVVASCISLCLLTLYSNFF